MAKVSLHPSFVEASFLGPHDIDYGAFLIALIDIPELFQSACTQSQGFRFFHTADPVSEIPRSIASMTPVGNLPIKTDIVKIVDMAPKKTDDMPTKQYIFQCDFYPCLQMFQEPC